MAFFQEDEDEWGLQAVLQVRSLGAGPRDCLIRQGWIIFLLVCQLPGAVLLAHTPTGLPVAWCCVACCVASNGHFRWETAPILVCDSAGRTQVDLDRQ
jgi:hypothetical protein